MNSITITPTQAAIASQYAYYIIDDAIHIERMVCSNATQEKEN